MKVFLADFFREENGKSSAKRLVFVATFAVMLSVIIASAYKTGLTDNLRGFCEFIVTVAASAYGIVTVGNKITDAASGNNPPEAEPKK